ncbi:MAG: LysR family transcriptional regulator substrate-binding protein [Fusicatenibacter saccharivorans]
MAARRRPFKREHHRHWHSLLTRFFAGRETLSLTELAEQPLILSNRYRKYMLSAFEQAGLFCDIYLTCEDARTAMTMAEKGLGIALLPASMLILPIN